MAAHDPDVVGDVNRHTSGTEFYGTSSNYVLLNQLFKHARLHLRTGHASSDSRGNPSSFSPSSLSGETRPALRDPIAGSGQNNIFTDGRISVINILSNEEALLPPSRAKTPPHVAEREQNSVLSQPNVSSRARHPTDFSPAPEANRHSHTSGRSSTSSHIPGHVRSQSTGKPSAIQLRLAERRLEREFVRNFLHNLHYLHPMLDTVAFIAQCNEEVWETDIPHEKTKDRRHFFALYNIVVAVGALVAGPGTLDELGQELEILEQSWRGARDSSQSGSFQIVSVHYFRRSRALLDDVFEACSLESAQTLLLMVRCERAYCRTVLMS